MTAIDQTKVLYFNAKRKIKKKRNKKTKDFFEREKKRERQTEKP